MKPILPVVLAALAAASTRGVGEGEGYCRGSVLVIVRMSGETDGNGDGL